MSDELERVTLAELQEGFSRISRFRAVGVREISDAPDDVAVSFDAEQSDLSPQTPEGEHAFLVNRLEFVAQLRSLLRLLDPTPEQQSIQVLLRIEKKLDE